MFNYLKEVLIKIIKSRLFVLGIVMIVVFLMIAQHLFTLQIVNGKDYLNNYTMSIEKEILMDGTRGNIYDRNGVLLAHNELSYTISLEDSGTYADNDEKAELLNEEISRLIDMIEKNGDSVLNTLDLYMDPATGELQFTVSGTALQGFRRDIFGRASVADLRVNPKLGYDEAKAEPQQILSYLIDRFSIDQEKYSLYRSYQIAAIRYALSLNSYQKYIATDIAHDVSEVTVAMIEEHSYELQGVGVREDTKRVYDMPEYFSHIIGYTGKISVDEYNTLSAQDDSYTLNDTIGKAGIEQVMELDLQGTKGRETVYVNNVGKILEVKDQTQPSAGKDIYLSIDSTLQTAVYHLLEQELAGILLSKIANTKERDDYSLNIPIYMVYNALIENGVISIDDLASAEGGTVSADVYSVFASYKESALEMVESSLYSDTPYQDQADDLKDYHSYIVSYLQNMEVFDAGAVDTSDETYLNWRQGKVSVKEYLMHAIDSSWVNITELEIPERYADTEEIYKELVAYIMQHLTSGSAFDKIIYKYLIYSDRISGSSLCMILFEQGVLPEDAETEAALRDGSRSAYTFLRQKISNLELTPAQLALDPCTGSCVIMDPNNGQLLACVSYPGYDTNRLANSMDSAYFNQLLSDGSKPFYNNATQQTTAPGSTYKMLIAAAGLTEGVITESTEIVDTGIFDQLDYNLKCWIYPSNHGTETVVKAIRDSCNYFFCEVGYRLSLVGENYNEQTGLSRITKYAEEFGFADKTNIEISEGNSKIADEYPVSASIGQSNNNFTTVQLCRYVAAIANQGTVYDLTLLDKMTDSDGNVLETYQPQVRNTITDLSPRTWSLIKTGMRQVVEEHKQFDDLQTPLAGKTGTAQESEDRPNHALFVGFAPNDQPQIAVATRIAYGYTSSNACDFIDTVMKYYFGQESPETLLNQRAADVGDSSNGFAD